MARGKVTPNGDAIAEARESADITQQGMADLLAMSLRNYQRIEDEEKPQPRPRMEDISEKLGVEVESIIRSERKTVRWYLDKAMEECLALGYPATLIADPKIKRIILDGVYDAFMEHGSVIITMSLTPRDIKRVISAYLAGKLNGFSVLLVSVSSITEADLSAYKYQTHSESAYIRALIQYKTLNEVSKYLYDLQYRASLTKNLATRSKMADETIDHVLKLIEAPRRLFTPSS